MKINQMLVNIPYMDDMDCEPPVKSEFYSAAVLNSQPQKKYGCRMCGKAKLGGGFKYFYVHPYLGKMKPF